MADEPKMVRRRLVRTSDEFFDAVVGRDGFSMDEFGLPVGASLISLQYRGLQCCPWRVPCCQMVDPMIVVKHESFEPVPEGSEPILDIPLRRASSLGCT